MYVVHAYMSTRVNGMANANRIDREPANNSPNSLLSLVLICLSPLCIDPARNSVSRVGDHARRQAAGDTPTPHTAATKSPHKSTVAGGGVGMSLGLLSASCGPPPIRRLSHRPKASSSNASPIPQYIQ